MPSSRYDRRAAILGLAAPLLAAPMLGSCSRAGASGALPDDMSLGNPNAKVTVVEYASVACPVCGRWYKEVWPSFKAKYVDTGKIHFTYREMLVGGNEEVVVAASGFLLARCAGRDKYFAIVDAIYSSQPALFDDPRGALLNIARSAGFSEAQFDACVKNDASLKALSERVEANSKKGGVDSTPTFVINGKALAAGYHPLTDLDAAIAAVQRA